MTKQRDIALKKQERPACRFRLDSFGDWTLIMAGNVLLTLPVVLIFLAFQRYFVEGMAMSGLKG